MTSTLRLGPAAIPRAAAMMRSDLRNGFSTTVSQSHRDDGPGTHPHSFGKQRPDVLPNTASSGFRNLVCRPETRIEWEFGIRQRAPILVVFTHPRSVSYGLAAQFY